MTVDTSAFATSPGTPGLVTVTVSCQVDMTDLAFPGIPGPVSLVDDTIRDCVPFNIMGTGHTSLQAADYLVSDKWNVGKVTQDFAEVVLSGQIYEGIGAGPFLLKTELGAGHGGPSGRYDAWRDEAFVLAFLIDQLTPA